MSSEQDVHLYFSPITPINEAGEAPPGRVTRVTLKMSRSGKTSHSTTQLYYVVITTTKNCIQ